MRGSTLLPLLTLVALAAPASAGIAPSFRAESLAWEATHIILVSEGAELDGEVEVVASWKGDLPPGTPLSLPELAAYAPETQRAVWSWDPEGRARSVSGERLLLFLKQIVEEPAQRGRP